MRICRTILVACLWLLLPQPEAPAQAPDSAAPGSGRRWNTWHFGYGAGLDFNGAQPRAARGPAATLEGVASISDPSTGALLFSTDGRTAWNRLGRPMRGGTDLGGHESSTQSALIVPLPASTTRYLLFTVDAFEDLERPESYTGLSWSVIDMSLDSGLGAISSPPRRLEPLIATEKLCAVRRCRDTAVWVIAHEGESDAFLSYLVTAEGIASTVLSRAGDIHGIRSDIPQRQSDLTGYLKASPDGRRLVAVRGGARTQIFDFDIETGRVRLASSIPDTIVALYGVSFSPNGRLLYAMQNLATGGVLVQYDLAAGDPGAVARSRRTIASYGSNVGSLQLGPDLRLYIAVAGATRVDVIEAPDSLGAACRWRRGDIDLSPGRAGWGLPNVIDADLVGDAADAGPDVTICPDEAVQLGAVNALEARWSPADGLDCTDCLSPRARPARTTTYAVTLMTLGGCTRVDSVTVTVRPRPDVDAGEDLAICAGDRVTLQGRGAGRLRWSPSTGLSCVDCPDPVATPTRTVTYRLTTWSDAGCIGEDSVTVTVNERPVVSAGRDTVVCAGSSMRLRASGATSYRWSPAVGLSCTDCATPEALVVAPVTYTVTGFNAAGCASVDSVSIGVRAPTPTRAWITDHRVAINRRALVPVRIDPAAASATVGPVTVRLRHRPDLLRLRGARVPGALGWRAVPSSSPEPGVSEFSFDRSPGASPDTLALLDLEAFLSDTTSAALELGVTTPDVCVAWTTAPGIIRLDSLCGLSLRLQRFAAHGLSREPAPNPFNRSLTLELTLATPAHVRVVLLDPAGREAYRAYDAPAPEGRLEITISADHIPHGQYILRVEFDDRTVAVRRVGAW